MSWLRRVFRGLPAPPRAPEPVELEGWLRAGFDCESRGEAAGAEAFYRKILEHDSKHADALYFLGRIAERDRREDEAVDLYQKAVALRPGEATYLMALGNALFGARRFAEAIEAYYAGVGLQPDYTDMRSNYAAALIELHRLEEASIELDRLRALQPDLPQVHFMFGGIYRDYGMVAESLAAYRRALELTPNHRPTFSNLLLTLNYSADHDAATHFLEHQRFGERFATRYQAPPPDATWPRRLRVGYLSPNFCSHVVSCFTEPILAHHDRARFEVFCYYVHRLKDPVTERLRGLAEHWLDCEEFSDAELADRIRSDRIDLLVDLAGHTADNRTGTLAMKPAPVQASYLGYPDITGIGAVDYRISDPFADPPGWSDRLGAERIVRLPHSYFCYRPPLESPEPGRLPGSAKESVTFGCFNFISKMSGAFLDAAARVLAAVPASRLLLKSRTLNLPAAARPVRERFERAGIDPARVDLRGWEPTVRSHLEAYREVDIALDSFPYNGATTTCEAMWMEVPVVTLVGDRHAGRMGSSLLNAVGLGELVARDVDEYVAICARLASDRTRLAELRQGLRDRMRHSPLMQEPAFVRDLERCFLDMWENRIRDRAAPPEKAEPTDTGFLAEARRLRGAGALPEAEALCREILRKQPDHPEALELLWDLSFDAGAPGSAIEWLLKATAASGQVARFHYMLGCTFQAQGKLVEAIASFRDALALDPALTRAHNNLGCVIEAAGNLQEAMRCYREAIRLEPRLAQAHYNLGNAYQQLGDGQHAIEHIEQAIAIEPGHADWHCNLGEIYCEQLKLDEAIERYRAALAIDSRYDRANSGQGVALLAAGRVEDAAGAFRKALELKPESVHVQQQLLLMLHYRQGEDADAVFREHAAWAARHARGLVQLRPRGGNTRLEKRRLNVGYVSPDFQRHSVAYFIEPVLAAHDRDAFDVFCYANMEREDEVTQRLRGLGVAWRDISRWSDEDAADRIRADQIDILVDLAGHTAGGRMLLFARKAAPVQVTWLGYPNTTGLAAMDYRLTDAVADPEGETDRYHTEGLVHLPRGFLCYGNPRDSPEVGEPPVLRNGGVTFGCFNNLAKVTPRMVALWAELLRALPGARLLMKSHGLTSEMARRDLQALFSANGIGPGRLELCPFERAFVGHLAKYGEVDIALDVFPYNGTTTTCEALWMGVPVVTLAGRTHVSRVGASLLSHAGMAELVAHNPRQYLEKALQLAGDPERLRTLRRGMRQRLRSSELLDAAGFTRALEAVYRELWART